ncbi:LLM class flavin-dependent oxidoreductase [Microlunatus sp. GCM10028923]|uniref:LLM class flavin-dependent oxidoreductase n=1 Tax=Microlunatus sp. GCM10028923 TaxID=3273400 RepID=UPI0036106900
MRLGIGLPTAGSENGAEAIAAAAEGAERIGLDSVWSFERLLMPTNEGYAGQLPDAYASVYAPMEVLAYVAAKTSRVTLGTSIMVALLHNPVDLARRFATLDQLSNGRAVVGLGQGWMPEEFEAAGVPLSRRGAGFAEFLEAMRAAWAPDPTSYDGRFYRFAESKIGPKPVQPGGPPILVAAMAPASLQRTAAAGLGINPIWFGWDALTETAGAFREAASAAGHDPAVLPIVLRVNASLTETAQGTEATVVGSPEQVAEAIPRLAELGVTEILWSMDLPVDDQLGLLGQLVG